MSKRRVARINEQLKREVTRILRSEVKDPRVAGATVTGAEASADLSYAKLYLNIIGDAEAKAEMVEGAESAAGFIRGELGRRLRLRRVPELDFAQDRSLQRAQRIESLLRDVLPEEERADVHDDGTSKSDPDG